MLKKNYMRTKFFFWSLAALMALAVSSCTRNSHMTDLLEHIPADADVVGVFDIKTIMESAGGSVDDAKIKLPTYILDELSSSNTKSFDEFNAIIKKSTVDIDAVAFTADYDKQPILVFSFSDRKKVINALEDYDFREKDDEDGIMLFAKKTYESSWDSEYDRYTYIALKDSYGYMMGDIANYQEIKPMREFSRLIDEAADEPYSKTAFADYIMSGNAGGVAIKLPNQLRRELKKIGIPSSTADNFDGVLCLKADLTDDMATMESCWYDENGKAKELKDFGKSVNPDARIDGGALKFLGKNESLVMAMSLEKFDWDGTLDNAAEIYGLSNKDVTILAVVKGYLNKIDGTVVIGAGVTNGLESFFGLNRGIQPLSQFDFTAVISMKKGKAKSTLNEIVGLIETLGPTPEKTAKGYEIQLPDNEGTLYAEIDDDYIILSNHKIKKGSDNVTAESIDFGRYPAAFAISMDRNNKLLSDLGIKDDINMSVTINTGKVGTTMRLEIKGKTTGGIIARAAKLIVDLINQEKNIENKMRTYYESKGYPYYGSSYDEEWISEVEAYEVPVEEYWDGDSIVVASDTVVAVAASPY